MITADMSIEEVLTKHPETKEIFRKYNLGCFGCQAAHFETLGQMTEMYGIKTAQFLADLNKAVEKGASGKGSKKA